MEKKVCAAFRKFHKDLAEAEAMFVDEIGELYRENPEWFSVENENGELRRAYVDEIKIMLRKRIPAMEYLESCINGEAFDFDFLIEEIADIIDAIADNE